MGVFIYPCKLKKKICDNVNGNEVDNAIIECEKTGVETLKVVVPQQYADIIKPFQEGLYSYDSGENYVNLSYGYYNDFLQRLEDIREVVDDYNAYSSVLECSLIDGVIGYEVAKEMLTELQTYQKQAKTYFFTNDGKPFGSFMWQVYEEYMTILEECIGMNGIIRYT